MVPLSRYWEILKLDPAADGVGYKRQVLSLAVEFFQAQFPSLASQEYEAVRSSWQHQATQQALYQVFRAQPMQNAIESAKAGLCLRCYVSYSVLGACRKFARLFAHHFTYRDLLPLVLEDDGRMPIILAQDGKTQLALDQAGTARSTQFPILAIEILRTYDPTRSAATRASLESWAYRHVKQHPRLKAFIAEQGFGWLSNWALLNRVSDRQLEEFSPRDRALATVFHQVYRRDRRRDRQRYARKCPNPTPKQLQEMCERLQKMGIQVNLATLLHELTLLAGSLQQLDRWISSGTPVSETIDEPALETGQMKQFADPIEQGDVSVIEERDLQDFCHQELLRSLKQAISDSLSEHVKSVRDRPRYAKFADYITQGLWLIYSQGKSQKEIAPLLGMTNQMQVSRVLGLKELLGRVRRHTVEKLFRRMVDIAIRLDLSQLTVRPDYIKNLQTAIEAFVDDEIFQAAEVEIMNTKHRAFNSLYAQQLRAQVQHYQEVRPA